MPVIAAVSVICALLARYSLHGCVFNGILLWCIDVCVTAPPCLNYLPSLVSLSRLVSLSSLSLSSLSLFSLSRLSLLSLSSLSLVSLSLASLSLSLSQFPTFSSLFII